MYRNLPIIFLFATVWASQAHANISRGAYEKGHSSAISEQAKSNNVPTVERETLSIDCSDTQCQVQAKYAITNTTEHRSTLVFVAPREGELPQVTVNKRIVRVTKVRDGRPADSYVAYKSGQAAYENRYRFTANMSTGSNTIEVKYRQEVSMYTAGSFGVYPFLYRRYNHYVGYYLYPLREWRLGKDFAIDVRFSAKVTPRYDDLKWRKMKCQGVNWHPGRCASKTFKAGNSSHCLVQLKQVKRNRALRQQFTLKQDFPDMLVCHLGKNM